jgi:hypothetical protein
MTPPFVDMPASPRLYADALFLLTNLLLERLRSSGARVVTPASEAHRE